jgi:hypothetical protein
MNLAVYGADGRLNRKFLLRTKAALASTTDLANDLRSSFDLKLDKSTISGVSRMSAHLHLLYHQVRLWILQSSSMLIYPVYCSGDTTATTVLLENEVPICRYLS